MKSAMRVETIIVTTSVPSSAEALYDQRLAAWESRIEEAVDDAAENGEGEITAAEPMPWAAASLLEMVDRSIADVVDKLRTECGALRRELEVERERRMEERRRRVTGTAALRKQIAGLEAAQRAQAETHAAALAEMRKALAAVEVSAARDRAHRRLLDSRRSYPQAQQADLERARRRTDQALARDSQ
jgi:hypothetical protein